MRLLTEDQRAGAHFLATRRVAYLADVPGLGKTAQYIRAVDLTGHRTFTVVCPPILRANIQREVDMWSYLGHDVTSLVSLSDEVPQSGGVAVSYSLAQRPEMLAKLLARDRGPLILDEAQALKEPGAQRTLALLGGEGLARRASHVWFVSGTPAPNHYGELYLFAKLSGAWRGSEREFYKRFCVTKWDHFRKQARPIASKNHAELRELLSGVMLRRTEVEGRPALSVDDIEVAGSDAFADLASEHADAMREALTAGSWDFPEIEQIATLRRLVGLAKVPGCIELVREELASGHKRLLIFGTHIDVLSQVAAGLREDGVRAEVLNGATSATRADELVSMFQRTDGGSQVLCINMVTGGTGLTLTAASRVFVLEPSWVPAENGQAIARAWRKGQTRPVHASFLGLAGSLDDGISKTVSRKVRELSLLLD